MAEQYWTNEFKTLELLNARAREGRRKDASPNEIATYATVEQLKRIADALEHENDRTLPMYCDGCGNVTDHEANIRFGRVDHFVCRACTWHKPVDCG